MKKRGILLICLCCLLMSVFLAGCGEKKYKITVIKGQDLIENCPKRAAAGETVTLNTALVSDADMFVRVNGDPDYCEVVQEGEYVFVMPAEDVKIAVVVVANGLA